jgi:hypothetical protein
VSTRFRGDIAFRIFVYKWITYAQIKAYGQRAVTWLNAVLRGENVLLHLVVVAVNDATNHSYRDF